MTYGLLSWFLQDLEREVTGGQPWIRASVKQTLQQLQHDPDTLLYAELSHLQSAWKDLRLRFPPPSSAPHRKPIQLFYLTDSAQLSPLYSRLPTSEKRIELRQRVPPREKTRRVKVSVPYRVFIKSRVRRRPHRPAAPPEQTSDYEGSSVVSEDDSEFESPARNASYGSNLRLMRTLHPTSLHDLPAMSKSPPRSTSPRLGPRSSPPLEEEEAPAKRPRLSPSPPFDGTFDYPSDLSSPSEGPSPSGSPPKFTSAAQELSSKYKKDMLWAAIQSDYQYLMDKEIIETCKVREVFDLTGVIPAYHLIGLISNAFVLDYVFSPSLPYEVCGRMP